jgi:thiol-disulfide isomerase/thioredoxin
MTGRSYMRLLMWFVLLVSIGLVIFVRVKRMAGSKSEPVAPGNNAPAFAPRQTKDQWQNEPVTDPALAETLLQGTTIEYYELDGNTPEELQASSSARNPAGPGTEGKTTYRLAWKAGDPSDGVCGLTTANVTTEVSVRMPRWVMMPNATDDAKKWWSYFIHNLARQQQSAVDQAHATAAQATPEMRGANCLSADSTFAAINARLAVPGAAGSPELQFSPLATPNTVPAAPNAASPAAAPLPISTTGQKAESTLPGHLPRGQSPMDYSLQLHSMDGGQITLDSQKGKVIVLNFWATWCGPCRAEMPGLTNLYNNTKNQNVFFGFVTNETQNKVQAFVSKEPLDLPIYLADQKSIQGYTAAGIPTTEIISKDGDRVLHWVGARQWDAPEVVKLLTDLQTE